MITLDVGGAGDCFFRAVLHQLYVNPNSHGIIRVAGVELLREKRKDLLKLILNIRGYNIYSCPGHRPWARVIVCVGFFFFFKRKMDKLRNSTVRFLRPSHAQVT